MGTPRLGSSDEECSLDRPRACKACPWSVMQGMTDHRLIIDRGDSGATPSRPNALTLVAALACNRPINVGLVRTLAPTPPRLAKSADTTLTPTIAPDSHAGSA